MFAMPAAMPCGSVAAYRASLGVSFRSGPSIPPPAARLRRDPVSRVSRAPRRALAPARFVRLIAHARRRTNFPRSFPSRGRRPVPDFSGLLPDAPFGPVASLCGRRPAEPPEVSCFVMFAIPPAMACGSVAAYRASFGVSFRSGPSIPPPRRTRRTLQMAALAPPPAARRGGTLFRAYRVRAPARVGAGAVRAPDCARETADALLPSLPAGFFSAPAAVLRRKAKSGPGSRLSVAIVTHFSSGQVSMENLIKYFRSNRDNLRFPCSRRGAARPYTTPRVSSSATASASRPRSRPKTSRL